MRRDCEGVAACFLDVDEKCGNVQSLVAVRGLCSVAHPVLLHFAQRRAPVTCDAVVVVTFLADSDESVAAYRSAGLSSREPGQTVAITGAADIAGTAETHVGTGEVEAETVVGVALVADCERSAVETASQ